MMTLDQHYDEYRAHPAYLSVVLQQVFARAVRAGTAAHHRDPEDLAQRVSLAVWTRWRALVITRSFSAYVDATIRNQLTNDARGSDSGRITSLDDHLTDLADPLYAPSRDAYRDASTLRGAQKRELAALLLSGMSVRQCAEQLHVPEAQLRVIARL